jgi:hypothetical protein
MSSSTLNPTAIPLIDGYGRLLRPAGIKRLVELSSQVSERDELVDLIYKMIPRFLPPVIESAAPSFDKRLRDDSYTRVVLFFGIVIENKHYQVALIIHQVDQPDKFGVCIVERDGGLRPPRSDLFAPLVEAINSELEQLLQSRS